MYNLKCVKTGCIYSRFPSLLCFTVCRTVGTRYVSHALRITPHVYPSQWPIIEAPQCSGVWSQVSLPVTPSDPRGNYPAIFPYEWFYTSRAVTQSHSYKALYRNYLSVWLEITREKYRLWWRSHSANPGIWPVIWSEALPAGIWVRIIYDIRRLLCGIAQ
jgi:hypothetical protein